ncbi:MAG TPA: TIGR03862 family flavoprotein [Gammaproteobacteria bacterium]
MPASSSTAAVIGGGPAGLMAAEVLANAGIKVDVYDAMPSPARKFLLAGIGGMNITHSEPFDAFVARYGEREPQLRALLEAFGPNELREWIHALGIETFVGSSGRVFPKAMKAAPLLRAWLHRLRAAGVTVHARHRWTGWDETGALRFETGNGTKQVVPDVVVLALGGGSWPRLGSDGNWQARLAERGVSVKPLLPANCGFDVNWSEHFRMRFAGTPVKPVVATIATSNGERASRRGEFIVTATGIEGGVVYALSALLRDEILSSGSATIHLDLAPDRSEEQLVEALSKPRGRKSASEHLRRQAGIHGVKAGLLREGAMPDIDNVHRLAAHIKALPLVLARSRPIDEAISSAGGVAFEALDDKLMLKRLPGVFAAGEMLDWEAPTGGYLLTACFASGRVAGEGALRWLRKQG